MRPSGVVDEAALVDEISATEARSERMFYV